MTQHHLDLNLSGSSMRFLHGEGPDISLEDVLEINVTDDASSPSTEVTSQVEDQARFAAAQSRCANILIYNRNDLPSAAFTRATVTEGPIVVNIEAVQTALAALPSTTSTPKGLEIVPWKPVPAVIALQLWPAMVASRQTTKTRVLAPHVILLPDPRDVQGSGDPSPMEFEFQTEEMQPSPPSAAGRNKRGGHRYSMLSLPAAPSNPTTPLVDSMVRRGTRMSSKKDGFQEVRLNGNPSKKRKTCPVLLIDEETGKAGPIPLQILQGWGVKCGIAPEELSDDALMQAPSLNHGSNE